MSEDNNYFIVGHIFGHPFDVHFNTFKLMLGLAVAGLLCIACIVTFIWRLASTRSTDEKNNLAE
jgi:membrane protein DedA with SNARE-associated domain